MFSVTPEPAVSNSAYGQQAKQPRAEQPPSDGFATLVDSNAKAASDSRSAPDAPPPSRRDQRDARRSDAPPANSDASQSGASSAPNDNSSPAQQDAGSSAPANANTGGDKVPGKVKAAGDKKADGEKTQDAEADAAATIPAVPAIIANAVVVTVATEPVATPADTSSTPAAIAASAAAAATAAIAATSSPDQKSDPSLAETPASTGATDTGTAVAAELAAALPADSTAPEAKAAKIVAAAGVIHSANGKTEVSAKNGETAAINKESKDGQQAADTSSTVTDQAIKPENDASNADGKPGQHDKAASEATTESPERTTKTQSERHASAAPAPLTAPQSDPGLQVPAGAPQQPVQTHAANLTAIPVTPAQAALAANTPVPLNSLAADIALRAAGGNSRFEIRLDPAELGRIDVRLEVDKHGNVTSHLTVERPATLDMLRNDAPKLQQALENAGLKTGDSGLQFSLRDQSSSGQNNDNGSSRNSQRVIITDEDTVPAQVAGRTYGRTLGASGGVDIRI